MNNARNRTSFVARPVAERFAELVSPEPMSGCHLWMGGCDPDGYGRIYDGVKTRRAHRLALEAHLGRLLTPLEVARHSCDNPPCVNPRHLCAGSPADNTKDRDIRGRTTKADGVKWAKLSSSIVASCRRRSVAGEPYASLAREFGVSKNSMWLAVTGRTWKSVLAAIVLLVATTSRGQPADAPTVQADAFEMMPGDTAKTPLVCMTSGKSIEVGKRIAACEAGLAVAESKTMIGTPVLVAAIVGAIAVGFAAGAATAYAVKR